MKFCTIFFYIFVSSHLSLHAMEDEAIIANGLTLEAAKQLLTHVINSTPKEDEGCCFFFCWPCFPDERLSDIETSLQAGDRNLNKKEVRNLAGCINQNQTYLLMLNAKQQSWLLQFNRESESISKVIEQTGLPEFIS